MKTPKMLPTLLLAILLGATLMACDSNSGSPATQVGAANQPANTPVGNPPAAGGSGDVKLTLVSHTSYTDTFGLTTHYIGVVRNDGTTTVEQPTVQLLEDSGKVVEADAAEAVLALMVLPPGKSAGFNLMYALGADIKNPQFKLSGKVYGGGDDLALAQVSIASAKLGAPENGTTIIEGDAKNDSDHGASLWAVDAIAYDAAGNIVDVGGGGAADPTQPFKAQSTTPFKAYLARKDIQVAKYDLLISGYQNPLR